LLLDFGASLKERIYQVNRTFFKGDIEACLKFLEFLQITINLSLDVLSFFGPHGTTCLIYLVTYRWHLKFDV